MPRKKYEVAMEIAEIQPFGQDRTRRFSCELSGADLLRGKGIFESVLWGPAVLVRPVRVELCAAPQYHSYITNYGGPLRNPTAIRKGTTTRCTQLSD